MCSMVYVYRQHQLLVEKSKRYSYYALVFNSMMFGYLCFQILEIVIFVPRLGSEYTVPAEMVQCVATSREDSTDRPSQTFDVSSNLATGLFAVFVFNFVLLGRSWISTRLLHRTRRVACIVPQAVVGARASTSRLSISFLKSQRISRHGTRKQFLNVWADNVGWQSNSAARLNVQCTTPYYVGWGGLRALHDKQLL